ncbi:hypothetical protein [Natrarchaeobaculum aegyptiacum]|uniref:hypothetical protein n=1 Tax=Natrarchaeobaculum aegyptiacum TaxID=745377 RepID=UPI001E64391F|nr:hypothetical protein [Natrarchaeobaculum aegyptiacum]
MTRSNRRRRRRVLTSAGSISILLLAGCLDPDGADDDEPDAEEGTGNGQDVDDDPETE